MIKTNDDIIEDMLVNSELARQLVPNKFKFTSQQGRIRRQKLIMSAKKLSTTKPIKDITLAEVCEGADIPRASAYHFFPNIEAVFLALKFLNVIEMMEAIDSVDIKQLNGWQDYITALMKVVIIEVQKDKSKAKLKYDTNTPDLEEDRFGEQVNNKVVKLVYHRMATYYQMPSYEDIKTQFLVAFSITDSIFTLSYRQHGEVTEGYLKEAIVATIAYLRCYLPENLPRKP